MSNLNELIEKAYLDECDDVEIAKIAQSHPFQVAQYYYFSLNEMYSDLLKRNTIIITITPKIYFDNENCLYDNEMLAIEEILNNYAIEIASSFYEVLIETTLENTEKYLTAKGFIQSEDFTKFTQV